MSGARKERSMCPGEHQDTEEEMQNGGERSGDLATETGRRQGHLFQIHFKRYWTLNAEARDGFLENCFLKIPHNRIQQEF